MRKPAIRLSLPSVALLACSIFSCGKGDSSDGNAVQELSESPSPGVIDGSISSARSPGDDSRTGIAVTVSGLGGQSTFTTSPLGAFSFPNGPVGDVTVRFARGACRAELGLADVTNNARLTLTDVVFDCASAKPSRVDETFQGVLENRLTDRVAVFRSCAAVGTGNRARVIKTDTETLFEDSDGRSIDFSELAPGDVIEASGYRENLGAPSSIVAGNVQRLARGQRDLCSGG